MLNRYLNTAFSMSFISILVLLLIIFASSVKTNTHNDTNNATIPKNFKEYFNKMMFEQSKKIQNIFYNIQENAKSMLKKLEKFNVKRRKFDYIRKSDEVNQVESPVLDSEKTMETEIRPRNQKTHLYGGTTGYESSGYSATYPSHYAAPVYHHHSLSFDPLNIVVSVSLISFLLQALQGLLSRTRLPTPVEQARFMEHGDVWSDLFEKYQLDKIEGFKEFESEKRKSKKYFKS